MSWLELSDELIEDVETGEFDYSGEFEVKSEVARVKIDSAYIDKADSGAMSFNVKFVKENGAFIDMQEWIKSGEAKGNKSTYTDKKNGKEKPLPGIINVQHFLKILGEDFKSIGEPKPFTMKVYGQDKEVKVFEKLRGQMLIVANEAYEDDYNDELKTKTRVVDWMNLDGEDYKGKPKQQYWIERFEKTPVKPLKVKKEVKKEPDADTQADLDNW